MTARDFSLALILCRRELRSGLRGFGVFLGCVFLGVLAISAVGSLSRAVEEGLGSDAKAMLGGDLSISLTARELSSSERDYISTLGQISRITGTRTMARVNSPELKPDTVAGIAVPGGGAGRAVLVELKAVDHAYPLYGELEVAGGRNHHSLLTETDGLPGALAEPDLLARLGIRVGDELRIGEGRFRLTGIITREPDRAVEFFNLGPRVMIATEAMGSTGLLRPGSLYRNEYLVRLSGGGAPGVAEDLRSRFPEAGWRVREYTNAAPRIKTVLERLGVQLTLVGLGALLVGGLGIAGGVRGYLEERLAHIAAMKCMGASVRVLFVSYLAQVLLLGFIGAVAGLGAGSTLPWLVEHFFADLLPVRVVPGMYAAPLTQAALFGLATTLAFAVAPLLRAVSVRPVIIFRGYLTAELPLSNFARLVQGVCFAVLAVLTFWFTNNPKLAAWFIGGCAGAFVLLKLVAIFIRWLAGLAHFLPQPNLRIGIGNIHRPGSPGVSLVFALGFGLTALVAVAMVNASLTRAMGEELSREAPAFFFMDIRPDQLEGFRLAVTQTDSRARLDVRPMIRGRIVRIKDVAVENATVSEEVQWAVRGDRGLSYTDEFPQGSTLVKGEWWGKGYAGPPLISITSDLAKGFGVDVGDQLTVNILGRNLSGTIASIREVDWTTLAMQFAILFSPGVLENAPQNWLGAIYGVANRDHLFERISTTFPEVAVVSIRDVLQNATRLLSRTVRVFQVMAGVALLTGFLVLSGAFAADQHRRIYDGVIYKVCGATRRTILSILAAEFALTGFFTSLVSLLLGTLAAWGVVQGLLHLHFTPDFVTGALTVAAAVAVSMGVGLLGTWRALSRKAAPYLRND